MTYKDFYKVTETQIVWTSSLFEKPERKFVVADYLGSYIKEWLFFIITVQEIQSFFETFIRNIAERDIKIHIISEGHGCIKGREWRVESM